MVALHHSCVTESRRGLGGNPVSAMNDEYGDPQRVVVFKCEESTSHARLIWTLLTFPCPILEMRWVHSCAARDGTRPCCT